MSAQVVLGILVFVLVLVLVVRFRLLVVLVRVYFFCRSQTGLLRESHNRATVQRTHLLPEGEGGKNQEEAPCDQIAAESPVPPALRVFPRVARFHAVSREAVGRI